MLTFVEQSNCAFRWINKNVIIVVMFEILGSHIKLLVIGSISVCDSQVQVKDLTTL